MSELQQLNTYHPRRFGLGAAILLILLLIVFSLLKPDTFPTYFNIRSILNNKSVQALLRWRCSFR